MARPVSKDTQRNRWCGYGVSVKQTWSVSISALRDLLWFFEVESVNEETDTGDNIMIGGSRLTRSVARSSERLSGRTLSAHSLLLASSGRVGLEPPNPEEEV